MAYSAYHSKNPLLAPLRPHEKSKEAFLPFWMMSGAVAVHVGSVKIGYSELKLDRYRKGGPITETVYRWVAMNRMWERTFEADQPQMQVNSSLPPYLPAWPVNQSLSFS